MILQPLYYPDMSNRDLVMLSRAADIAKQSTERHKHGALIYKSGRVLGIGINTFRNRHPTMDIPFSRYTVHAEIAALRSTGYRDNLQGATVYVARINREGGFMNSEPCAPCEQALMANGIKRVVFSV